MYVPVDRTENDPLTFREVLREFEQERPRDEHGRFTKKEKPNAR
jgi:hypothetical protein